MAVMCTAVVFVALQRLKTDALSEWHCLEALEEREYEYNPVSCKVSKNEVDCATTHEMYDRITQL